MDKILKGKVAVVTGGSKGIGHAISGRLAAMGASVVVNYAHGEKEADETVRAIEECGGTAVAVQADMGRTRDVAALFERTDTSFGRLDILVNNAGMLLNQTINDLTEDDFDTIMALNIKGVFFCCREAAHRMADGGRIINISSTVTRMLLPTYGLYAATKGAVDQLTRVLAKELGSRRITVNSLSPGPVDTELFRRGKTEEQVQGMAAMAALGRIGTPVDIADAVSLLVREESSWISGQNIGANGGMA